MDIKRAETKLILMQAALDACDMFKKIVWAICAIAAVVAVRAGVVCWRAVGDRSCVGCCVPLVL